MAVTRDDVARLANVSSATVSYVINNGPRPVSDATRQKVLRAIQELGYQPSAIARNLRLQRTYTIGLILPDTHNPYFAEVLRGIENTAFENGYKIILLHSGYDPETELEFIDFLRAERVDGVIWIPATSDFTPLKELGEHLLPTVVFDRVGLDVDTPVITVDNVKGGYIATRHLIQLGHRLVGFIARPEELSHSKGRLEGYRRALQDYGLRFELQYVVPGGFFLEDGRRALCQLLGTKPPPTAVFAYNDMMAIGALRCAYERGLHVPNDFSIVGFDDIAQAEFTCPALTTIFQDKFAMGQRAINVLIHLIDSGSIDPTDIAPLEVNLVVRESTGPPNENALERLNHRK